MNALRRSHAAHVPVLPPVRREAAPIQFAPLVQRAIVVDAALVQRLGLARMTLVQRCAVVDALLLGRDIVDLLHYAGRLVRRLLHRRRPRSHKASLYRTLSAARGARLVRRNY